MSDCFISVDVETAGPTPDRHAMLSIGAVAVESMADTFYIELQPDRAEYEFEALEVCGLSMEKLAVAGVPPEDAMRQFAVWIEGMARGRRPVFVAYNAPFDWMFVNVYFHRYLGHNPFGHSALDMKALYMGLTGSPWASVRHDALAARYGVREALIHNALDDAVDQALLFNHMLAEAARNEVVPTSE